MPNPPPLDKGAILGTKIYFRILQIFLKIAKCDTWRRVHIGHLCPSPSTVGHNPQLPWSKLIQIFKFNSKVIISEILTCFRTECLPREGFSPMNLLLIQICC
uniref:Uncharacterized protein n=1 Tax=Opuntia streptacantha TaxID=393608 RepID=A0A7C8ZEW2_OPUST